jgi:gamma-glutamyltranspeptidase/glutathione hydrolase
MTMKDLKNYRVSIRKPIDITYRGYKLFSTGAPSGGSVALSILKIIEGYDMSDPSMLNLSTHRLDEAMRFSYGARVELGDPDFFNYMDDFEATMLKPKTAEEIRRRLMDDKTQNPKAYNPKGVFLPENHGTSHVVTADESGMTITLTSTVNLLFGSRLIVPETGMISHFPVPLDRYGMDFLTGCRSNHEQRNERLLHPRNPERIRLRPQPHKLHST